MATRKSFQCPKCKRTFSMAAHLGRHRATIHGPKTARKQTRHFPASAKAKARWRVPAGAPARLLGDVRAWRGELAAQQAQRAVQLAALDRLLETLRGTAPRSAARLAPRGRRRRGGARAGSLKSYVDRVLRASHRPLRVAEITAAVRQAGYKTRNRTLAKSVGVALVDLPGVKKVGRGVFSAK